MTKAMNKTGIFVDVQNIYYTTREAYNKQFNYRRFWQVISMDKDITMANAYAVEPQDSGQRGFQQALRNIGFNVKLRPFIQRQDGSAKADWDVGITIDTLEAAKDLDSIILLSGDGDFAILLDHLAAKYGVMTEVYGVPTLTANALIKSASVYRPISESLLQ